jgi:hypothetical protein
MVNPQEMIGALRNQSLRSRTGVLALSGMALGTEGQIAAVLGVELLDYRDVALSHVLQGSQYLNLTLSRVFDDLDELSNSTRGESCVLLANFDIAVTKLRSGERTDLWRRLFSDFPHRKRALVLCVPEHSDGRLIFQDSAVRHMWQESDRYAVWQASQSEKGTT